MKTFKITSEELQHLKDAHGYLNLVEVKGGGNVGNLFQALVRIEAVISDILKRGEIEESPEKEE